MIWYDAQSGEPVAPGSCEDSGVPSIPTYPCPVCGENRQLEFHMVTIGKVTTAFADCRVCETILLTSG